MQRTRQEKIRLGVMAIGVVFFFGIVVARLVHLQVFQADRYSRIVKRQSSGTIGIPAERGLIYDRNGQVVAKNVAAQSLYAYPTSDRQCRDIAAYLDKLYGFSKGTSRKKYTLKPRRFTWIDRTMDETLAAAVTENAPEGLTLREETRRSYPFHTVGKQILGFTDIDNIGRSGLELTGDSLMAGDSGIADIRRDGLRNTYRVKESALIKPVAGKSLVLTVDWRLQDIVEQELAAGVEEYHARYAMAAFLDIHTGEILAIAHFDPDETNREKPTKLRAITDWFEPGSSFKAFVAAGLLDNNLVNFDDTVYCEMGEWKLGRRRLRDDKKHGWLDFRHIIELSSNIGIGKCAIEMGGDELLATVKRFGFGQKLRCGLPGESAGKVSVPNRWSEYTVSALAMGHSVAVNALQMASGYAAIANGGQLLRPHIVLGYVDHDGRLLKAGEPELIGRAMEPESCDSLQAFLRGVVEAGTATPVNSPVISIAGKTGTGEMPDLTTGRMFKNRFVASFAGFFPYENPLVAGIVVMVDPRPVTYGGYTSGPTFRRIAERYVVIQSDKFQLKDRMLAMQDDVEEATVETPDFIGRDISLVAQIAKQRGIKVRCTGSEGVVAWQFPPADRLIVPGEAVIVALQHEPDSIRALPDLRGMPVRSASAYLSHLGLTFRVEGSGLVVRQYPPAGESLNRANLCRLMCQPG
jgi:cell division protein FtsI/penicillin-binding protein 2